MWSVLYNLGLLTLIIPMPIIRFLWRTLDVFDGKLGAVFRYVLVCRRLGQCGKNVFFAHNIYIDNFKKLRVGNNVSIHTLSTILTGGGVHIGNNVSIAHGVSVVSGEHTWELQDTPIKYNPVVMYEVKIDDDVWIGCGVKILSNVHIGKRVVVAAGGVVTKSLDNGGLYGGIPAKLIKKIV